MGDDIQELMRLRRIRRQLELPAYLFERYATQCKGDCDHPVVISPTMPEALTCCHLQPSWEKYHEVRVMEKSLSAKVQQYKNPEPIEAPLANKYERTFTGTYVGRKLFEGTDLEHENGNESDAQRSAMDTRKVG